MFITKMTASKRTKQIKKNFNRVFPHCLHIKVQLSQHSSRSFAKLTLNYLNIFTVPVPYLAWVVVQSFSVFCGTLAFPNIKHLESLIQKYLMLNILHGKTSSGNVSSHIPNLPIGSSMINEPHWPNQNNINPARGSEKFCSEKPV